MIKENLIQIQGFPKNMKINIRLANLLRFYYRKV